MSDEVRARARAILDANRYMTIATADADGLPWASPVWVAVADPAELYWVSRPGARHSRNIAERAEIAIVIFDSTVPPGTGGGLYMAATAERIEDDAELQRGIEVFSRHSVEHGARPWSASDVSGDAELRLYRAGVSAWWVLGEHDQRIEVDPR